MNIKLSHLSKDQIDELINRYYKGEKTTDLIEEYNINISTSGLVGLFPPEINDDLYCPFCDNQSLISKRPSRSGYGPQPAFCPMCKHNDGQRCTCTNCQRIMQEKQSLIRDEKRQSIEDNFGSEIESNLKADLSLEEAVYILSLSRHSLSEDLYFVEPYSDNGLYIAATYDFRDYIAMLLQTKKIIKISPTSPIEAFIFEENLSISSYYPTRICWEFLPGIDVVEKAAFLTELEKKVKHSEWPESWSKGIAPLWHKIAKFECLEYFNHLLSQRGFELDKFGDKTHSTFENLLNDFSTGQVFNLTWQAVRDTTDFIVKEKIPKYRGKNNFIGAIQRKADRYIAEKWELRNSRRDFDCPQTIVSSTFFNLFLNEGQKAFEKKPPKIND